MSEKPTYTMEYDETIPTHERDGVVEHKHAGFEYWHPVSRKHDGCGRTDHGVDSDVRMCMACDCVNHVSMCHTRRRQLGLKRGLVAHGVETNKRITSDSIDRANTLLVVDEAIAELVSAKSLVDRVRKDSDHVQQAEFEQFTRDIDGVVVGLLKVCRHVYEEMEAERDDALQ